MSGMIDVQVSNIFTEVQYGSGQSVPFAVRNPSDMEGKLQPLSAGPKFRKKAKDFLMNNLEADPEGFSGNKACCRIPREKLNMFVGWVSEEYTDSSWSSVIDLNHCSELEARLTRPYWNNIKPPLSEFEFLIITLDFHGFKFDFSTHDIGVCSGQVTKVHLFAIWHLWVSEISVLRKLRDCPAITLLGAEGHHLRLPK